MAPRCISAPRPRTIDGRGVTLTTGLRIDADAVVNAAGWQAARLTPGLEIRPKKGHLVITDRYPGFIRHQVLELGYLKSTHTTDGDSVAFNVQPRRTGQILVGSSRQFDVSDPRVDRPILERMINRAIEYMPGLARLSAIRAWTGFRAATPDSLPIIGPHPDSPGLYLATGHEGLGITTSLGTAELIVDHILGRPSAIPSEPYLPARLAVATSWLRAPPRITINGLPLEVPHRHDDRRRDPDRESARRPPFRDGRAARPALRDGHLLRMPRDGRRRAPAADLPDGVP